MLPRIVVVDPTPTLARIARGALALLDKAHILIEVPSAEAALGELAAGHVALLLSVLQLPDLDGLQLARQALTVVPDLPVIVLADADDPLPPLEEVAAAPCRLYVRPVAEAFLRGLRSALEGESAATLDVGTPVTDESLGPVPPVEVDRIRGPVATMMRDVGAMGALVSDRTGRIVFELGATGAIDRAALAAMVGAALTRTVPMGALVGGNAWTMHYYDGERFDVFVLALGVHYFLLLIFDGANRSAFGPVTMYGRRVADQIIRMLGDAAYRVTPPSQSDGTGGGGQVSEAVPAPRAQPTKSRRSERRNVTASPPPQPDPLPLDLDALFGQEVDEELAERLFDPEDLGQLAASLDDDPDQVDFDEAHGLDIFDTQ